MDWMHSHAFLPSRTVMSVMALTVLLSSGGCGHHRRHRQDLVMAQQHARELYAENQQLMAGMEQAQQLAMGMDQERNALMSQLADTQSQLSTANDRLNNMMSERSDLNGRLAQGLTDGQSDGSGFNSALQSEGFEYDPVTGLNKFRSDILFDLGSDAIRPEAEPLISEFASTVMNGSAKGMKILVVGHTDDQNIVRPETALKHPTNWHLSTDRSDAVILKLLKAGVDPDRIASMGYSEFHPLEISQSDTARQRNRRVELYVVPNDPNVARWDPVGSVRN